MSINEFLESKRILVYYEAYFNYSIIDEALNNVYNLEREKAYGFNFTIKEPNETESSQYEVIPSVTNQHFKDEYQSFLNLLQCELNRIDGVIQHTIDELKLKLSDAKQQFLTSKFSKYIPSLNDLWNYSVSNWFGESDAYIPSSDSNVTEKIRYIEKQLKILKDNVIPLNKFALSKILKKKANLVEKSRYNYILLEVETGIEISPPPRPFPIMGKNNRYNCCPSVSEKSDSFDSFDSFSKSKPSFVELIDKNRNFLCKSVYSNSSDLQYPNRNLCFRSSISSLTSGSSMSSTFSNDDIVKNINFWHSAPKQVSTLLDEIKCIKKCHSCLSTRDRLIREIPY